MASQPTPPPESIDVDEIRVRLQNHRKSTGKSWTSLSAAIGIPQGTLTAFVSGSYTGDNIRLGLRVDQWFAAEAQRTADRLRVLKAPSFQSTRAARRVMEMLRMAQLGDFAVAATAPGFGKTSAVMQYQSVVPNVWVATMRPSSAGVQTMLTEVLASMGERDARGSPQMLTRRIIEKVRNTEGLIILDDAQHLSAKALEELRGIHDVTGIGIALIGNAGLLAQLEGGSRHVAYAQLFSRLGWRIVEAGAYAEDALVIGRAWGVEDEKALDFLVELAGKPGGLRSVSKTLKSAAFLAANEGSSIAKGHLVDAWANLSARPLAS